MKCEFACIILASLLIGITFETLAQSDQSSRPDAQRQEKTDQASPSQKLPVVFRRVLRASPSTAAAPEGVTLIEGKITGRIVVRTYAQETDGTHSFAYILLDGENVESIDANGVACYFGTLIMYQRGKNKRPNDSAVISAALSARGDGILGGTVVDDALVWRMSNAEGSVFGKALKSGTLLGEYTTVNGIIDKVEISSGGKIVKVPVRDFVKFKEKSEEPKQ